MTAPPAASPNDNENTKRKKAQGQIMFADEPNLLLSARPERMASARAGKDAAVAVAQIIC